VQISTKPIQVPAATAPGLESACHCVTGPLRFVALQCAQIALLSPCHLVRARPQCHRDPTNESALYATQRPSQFGRITIDRV
jgi:hypothetical protein